VGIPGKPLLLTTWKSMRLMRFPLAVTPRRSGTSSNAELKVCGTAWVEGFNSAFAKNPSISNLTPALSSSKTTRIFVQTVLHVAATAQGDSRYVNYAAAQQPCVFLSRDCN
jgi:hypothetical protein